MNEASISGYRYVGFGHSRSHSYWKNLALAMMGKMDAHFTALWDHGYIKSWSINRLSELLREAAFKEIRFAWVGRIPVSEKSMRAAARKLS